MVGRGSLSLCLAISLTLVALSPHPVAGVPFSGSDSIISKQALLYADDPLKDFISSVTNDKEEVTSVSPPSSPLPSPQFSSRINDVDSISIEIEPQNDRDANQHTLIRPSWFTSILMARRLLALSTTGVASTVYPDSSPSHSHAPPGIAGVPVNLPEYIADCEGSLPDGNDDGKGNPVLLGLYVSTTFRNSAAGSNISLSLDWWNNLNKTSPLYPGFPLSAAGLPRVSLLGYVERFSTPIANATKSALESCFLASHPDAKAWLPGNPDSPHAGFWAKMIVTQAYWIGGFGDIQQIGWINITEWSGIRKTASLPGVGDGRGWDDVRLPGEEA